MWTTILQHFNKTTMRLPSRRQRHLDLWFWQLWREMKTVQVKLRKKSFFSFFTSARSIFHALFFPFNVLPLHIARAHTGMNSAISYSIQTDNKSIAEYFHVDENEGTVFLKKSLDHETIQRHHFTIRASDKGSPTLSSSKYHHVTTRCSESSN